MATLLSKTTLETALSAYERDQRSGASHVGGMEAALEIALQYERDKWESELREKFKKLGWGHIFDSAIAAKVSDDPKSET